MLTYIVLLHSEFHHESELNNFRNKTFHSPSMLKKELTEIKNFDDEDIKDKSYITSLDKFIDDFNGMIDISKNYYICECFVKNK